MRKRAGLSLLEVLTALAIFLLSIVVISQMVDSAAQTALRAQRLTRAGIYAESKMSEVVAGIEPLDNVAMAPLPEGDPGWYYSIQVEPESWTQVDVDGQQVIGLNLVTVTVGFTGHRATSDVEQSMTRVVMDPLLRVPAADPVIEGTPSTSSGGGATQGGGGATGSGGGGGGSGGGGGGGGAGGGGSGGGGGPAGGGSGGGGGGGGGGSGGGGRPGGR